MKSFTMKANPSVPDGWRDVRIGEIANLVGGSTPSTKVPEFFDGDIPWVTPRDLSSHHDRYVYHGARSLSEAGLNSCSAKLLPRGAVLLSTRAPIGYVAIAGTEVATNQGFRSLLFSDDVIPEYAYYWLKDNTEELKRHASGSTFQELSGSALKEIRIPLPPLAEQREIARVLGALDDKIELNRRMNRTLEDMARALFQSWFVDFDPVRAKAALEPNPPHPTPWPPARARAYLNTLPPKTTALFPSRLIDSELGPIPEGWQVKPLGDIAELVRDSVNPLTEPRTIFSHFSIPAYDDGQTPKQERGESIKSAKSRVPPGSVLLSKLNPEIERVWLADVESEPGQAVCSTEFLVLRPKPPFQRSYLYCLARSIPFREQLQSLVTGTSKSHQRAPARDILSMSVPIPLPRIAEVFETTSWALFSRALVCRRGLRMPAALRDTLIQKLVSGEVRAGNSIIKGAR